MEFIISENAKKKLEELIKGNRNCKDNTEYIKRISEHLEKYHFKQYQDIIEYLKDKNKVIPTKPLDNIDFITCNNNFIDIWRKNINGSYFIEPITLDMFKDRYFFTFLPDSNGYISNWHKDI